MPGTLYLVATPIGNLQDMTFRAVETLRTVDVIACEDTRHTRKLLTHFRISSTLISYHEHNEHERAEELAERLVRGESVAIVSDAGTPGICDPGYRVVQRAIEIGATVTPIPGPVAFVAAAIGSGLPTDAMFFGGFLPAKKGDRRKRLSEIKDVPALVVLYESPHRLAKSLIDCLDVLGNRSAVVARELTKLHEEISRGTLSDLVGTFSSGKVRGEMVIVIDRAVASELPQPEPTNLIERVRQLENSGSDRKASLKQAAKEFGISKSQAYRILESEKS